MNTEATIEEYLAKLELARGAHASVEEGACVMEAVAYVSGEGFNDHPKCASAIIGAFMRSWNDSLNDTDRQKLKPYIKKLVGSADSDAIELKRARLAQDWYIRVFTPTWLSLAGLEDHAETLRGLNEIVSDKEIVAAHPALSAADNAAWSAARSAAWSAADNAAWSAARSAADSAARSAAWSAADNAAWSAARSAAWSAACSAAWSAVRNAADSAADNAAWSAACSAAWSAAWSAAYSAVYSAAEQALEPTVKRLQESVFDLLNRMLEVRS